MSEVAYWDSDNIKAGAGSLAGKASTADLETVKASVKAAKEAASQNNSAIAPLPER